MWCERRMRWFGRSGGARRRELGAVRVGRTIVRFLVVVMVPGIRRRARFGAEVLR